MMPKIDTHHSCIQSIAHSHLYSHERPSGLQRSYARFLCSYYTRNITMCLAERRPYESRNWSREAKPLHLARGSRTSRHGPGGICIHSMQGKDGVHES